MFANRIRRSLPLTGLAATALLALSATLGGCVGSDDAVSEETEAAYALRSGLSGSADGSKTYVCHIPPGNVANAHTIHVGNPAVDAHLAHGDSLGQCHEVLVADTGSECHKRHAWSARKKIQHVVVNENGAWKVSICHLPPGNPSHGLDLTVGAAAVQAHLAHGDSLGACNEGYTTPDPLGKDTCKEKGGDVETGDETGGDTTGTGGDTTVPPGGDTTGTEVPSEDNT